MVLLIATNFCSEKKVIKYHVTKDINLSTDVSHQNYVYKIQIFCYFFHFFHHHGCENVAKCHILYIFASSCKNWNGFVILLFQTSIPFITFNLKTYSIWKWGLCKQAKWKGLQLLGWIGKLRDRQRLFSLDERKLL